jgi:hypothetical protein
MCLYAFGILNIICLRQGNYIFVSIFQTLNLLLYPNSTFFLRSGDGTARIWRVPGEPSDSVSDPIVLQHSHGSEQKDVTTLDWNVRNFEYYMNPMFLLLSFSYFFSPTEILWQLVLMMVSHGYGIEPVL